MGLLSSTVSITRYKVKGELEEPVIDTVSSGLRKNAISEIDNETFEKAVGWTTLENPFSPDFESTSFLIGAHFVFSLRIDKKTIPSKIVKKHFEAEVARKMAETNREAISRAEKQEIREHVLNVLSLRIPATPNIYDIIWHYEDGDLWFLSTQKAANEELETLFSKSFKLTLIRLFPYTVADMNAGLSEAEQDVLSRIMPTSFRE